MERNNKIDTPYVARFLGLLGPDRSPEALDKIARALGVKLIEVGTLEGRDITTLRPEEAAYFADFGIVSTAVDIEQKKYRGLFATVERERITRQIGAADPTPAASSSACAFDTPKRTWGLYVTGVSDDAGQPATNYDGTGIKVAILDSGIDLNHEAFQGASITLEKPGAAVDDGVHGTHCAATICGQPPATGRRIGIAPKVELFVAKIFGPSQTAPDTRILEAIRWAVKVKGCHIVSMSIGARIPVGRAPSPLFEGIVEAYKDKAVFVAGVGNGSRRNVGYLSPVNHPANCNNILAVGAMDECKRIGNRSNRSEGPNSGKVRLVAPGLRVTSAKANSTNNAYRLMDGTSAATAHASGIVALWAQQSGARGAALRDLVYQNHCEPLPIPDYDAGNGLVKAP